MISKNWQSELFCPWKAYCHWKCFCCHWKQTRRCSGVNCHRKQTHCLMLKTCSLPLSTHSLPLKTNHASWIHTHCHWKHRLLTMIVPGNTFVALIEYGVPCDWKDWVQSRMESMKWVSFHQMFGYLPKTKVVFLCVHVCMCVWMFVSLSVSIRVKRGEAHERHLPCIHQREVLAVVWNKFTVKRSGQYSATNYVDQWLVADWCTEPRWRCENSLTYILFRSPPVFAFH